MGSDNIEKMNNADCSPEKDELNQSAEMVNSSSLSAAEPVSDEDNGIIAKKDWYILKVQVNREDSIKRRLEERVRLAHLEDYIEEILVPTETITEVKNGKKRNIKRKLYPGYLIVKMEINETTWFLIRETSGIGDFTGANGKPVAMQPYEVQRLLQTEKAGTPDAPKVRIPFQIKDIVKITDGSFEGMEGEVTKIDEDTGRVTVIITIFARSTPVDLEYWQVEKAS